MTDDEKVANRLANDLVRRANGFADRTQPIGVTLLIAEADRAASLRAATQTRWKSMLSAYSAGIAHADRDVDTTDSSNTLRQLQKVEIAVVIDASHLPPRVFVAYAAIPLDAAWRSALESAGATIVDATRDA